MSVIINSQPINVEIVTGVNVDIVTEPVQVVVNAARGADGSTGATGNGAITTFTRLNSDVLTSPSYPVFFTIAASANKTYIIEIRGSISSFVTSFYKFMRLVVPSASSASIAFYVSLNSNGQAPLLYQGEINSGTTLTLGSAINQETISATPFHITATVKTTNAGNITFAFGNTISQGLVKAGTWITYTEYS